MYRTVLYGKLEPVTKVDLSRIDCSFAQAQGLASPRCRLLVVKGKVLDVTVHAHTNWMPRTSAASP